MNLSKKAVVALSLWLGIAASPVAVLANPFFYLDGSIYAVENARKSLPLYLDTDGSTLTAAQVVLNYSSTYLSGTAISNLNSRCSFWAPADPSLGYGTTVSPYFHQNNKAVVACGFSNPGYTSGANASLIATITFTPQASGSTTLSFSNPMFRYIGSSIAAGASPNFSLEIYESTESAVAAQPTATPTAPGPTTNTISIVSDPSDTLTADDLTLVEVDGSGSSTGSTSGTNEGVVLEAVDDDNSIPPVPELTPREKPSPFVRPSRAPGEKEESEGDVLSVSSLRELLIPGKSSADKTVVLVNFISTLTFLALLAIALWRMITISKINRVKYQHMQDILAGELSVLQTKVGGLSTKKASESLEDEIKQSFESLVNEVRKGDEKVKPK